MGAWCTHAYFHQTKYASSHWARVLLQTILHTLHTFHTSFRIKRKREKVEQTQPPPFRRNTDYYFTLASPPQDKAKQSVQCVQVCTPLAGMARGSLTGNHASIRTAEKCAHSTHFHEQVCKRSLVKGATTCAWRLHTLSTGKYAGSHWARKLLQTMLLCIPFTFFQNARRDNKETNTTITPSVRGNAEC